MPSSPRFHISSIGLKGIHPKTDYGQCAKWHRPATRRVTILMVPVVETNNAEERLARIERMVEQLQRDSAAMKRVTDAVTIRRSVRARGRRTATTDVSSTANQHAHGIPLRRSV